MTSLRACFAGAVMAAAAAAPATAQTAPSISIRAGVAISNRYGNTAREAGPDVGAGLVVFDRHRLALEVAGSMLFFSSSQAIPTCLPATLPDPGGCSTHVSSPGPVLGAGVNAVLRAGPRAGVFAGLGFSGSTGFPAEPTVEHRNAWSAQAGLRLRPFAAALGGLGLELRATRYFRAIGEVRTVMTPSLTWVF